MADISLKDRIITEVRDKVDGFDARNSNFFSKYNLWSEMFQIQGPARSRSQHQLSNPRLTETFKAVNSLATLTYRATKDAAGVFVVDLLHDNDDPTQRTFLFPTPVGAKIEVVSVESARVTVEPTRTRVSGRQ